MKSVREIVILAQVNAVTRNAGSRNDFWTTVVSEVFKEQFLGSSIQWRPAFPISPSGGLTGFFHPRLSFPLSVRLPGNSTVISVPDDRGGTEERPLIIVTD